MKTKTLFLLAVVMILAACTKEGDTIYQMDPDEPKASAKPLVTVIYDPDALGDRSYNDLIYRGVEEAAAKYGLRTMQLSPTSYDEGLAYMQAMMETVRQSQNDSVKRLYIVAAASYEDYLRQNSEAFNSNPNADLLYLETDTLLESKGSTLYLPYYGAMYEAGALLPVFNSSAVVIGSNPVDATVAGAIQGLTDGFQTYYYRVESEWYEWEKSFSRVYLAEKAGEGYNIADSTAFRVLSEITRDDYLTVVPICGGSGSTLTYLVELYASAHIMGVDVQDLSGSSFVSAVKHIDRAVNLCIGQWLSPEGMPKHQVFGLDTGFTEVMVRFVSDYLEEEYNQYISAALRRQIHEDAIRKEAEYEKM